MICMYTLGAFKGTNVICHGQIMKALITIMIHSQTLHLELAQAKDPISRYVCVYETDIHSLSPRLQ